MNHHFEAAIITNDLDSLRYRIEALPAMRSRRVVSTWHQRKMRDRFAKRDAA